MIKKTLCIFFIAALLAMAGVAFAETVCENSGAITTATQLYTGPGGVNSAQCSPDGTNACICTLYDTASGTAAGKQLPSASAAATSRMLGVWTTTSPVRFTQGLYVVPSANSICFVTYLPGIR